MARRDARGIAGLEDVRERLESWRRTRTTRGIPEPLWRSAVRLARRAGVYPVARALGLNYESLKDRLAASECTGDGGGKRPTFVEIQGGEGFGGGALTVEISTWVPASGRCWDEGFPCRKDTRELRGCRQRPDWCALDPARPSFRVDLPLPPDLEH